MTDYVVEEKDHYGFTLVGNVDDPLSAAKNLRYINADTKTVLVRKVSDEVDEIPVEVIFGDNKRKWFTHE